MPASGQAKHGHDYRRETGRSCRNRQGQVGGCKAREAKRNQLVWLPKTARKSWQLSSPPTLRSNILLQLPRPKHLDGDAIIQSILPEKDVDGLPVVNAGKLVTGDLDTGLVSCIPAGAMVFVRRTHGEDLSDLNAVVIGRSNLFGKAIAQLY